ncbi:MAG: Gfo/Idh/MocA family oxidoreductase [Candidatus Omnitrophica bacterium]|nr:Gfo/Idh/MocA family oxidoreductase [Candidatus Omnitrophota bacterium]
MTTDKKLKVGIAGYGIVGKRRRQYIDSHPNLVTVGVCDQILSSSSGFLPDGVKCFSHYRQLLNEPLDVLFVSLPNYLAPEVTIAGLDKGLHVFCEKPPGRNVEDIQKVLAAKRKYPKSCLKYGFNHRYHQSVREALRITKSGELGEIINMRGVYGKSRVVPFDGNWRSQRKYAGGGILLDQGIHMVDLMRLFCGDFVEVKSFVSNGFWKHDVEDNAYALMKDKKGRIAFLHSSATQWQHRFSLDIHLSKGYLGLQGILSGTKSYGEERLVIGRRSPLSTGTEKEEIITYVDDNSWRDEIHEFADAVIHHRKIVSGTAKDAFETMKLVYQIYQADPQWRKRFHL